MQVYSSHFNTFYYQKWGSNRIGDKGQTLIKAMGHLYIQVLHLVKKKGLRRKKLSIHCASCPVATHSGIWQVQVSHSFENEKMETSATASRQQA
jgi:hypothetical protein